MITLKWEDIQHGGGFTLKRAPVPGGWLVAATFDGKKRWGNEILLGDLYGGVTFVPDTAYFWKTQSQNDINNTHDNK